MVNGTPGLPKDIRVRFPSSFDENITCINLMQVACGLMIANAESTPTQAYNDHEGQLWGRFCRRQRRGWGANDANWRGRLEGTRGCPLSAISVM